MKRLFLFSICALIVLLSGCNNPVSTSTPVSPSTDFQIGKSKISDIPQQVKTLPKSGDQWLFMAYLAADNSLVNDIWADLNEMEYGLYQSAPDVAIDIYVFWDGGSGKKNTAYIAPVQSKIYKLGADNRLHADGTTSLYDANDPYSLLSDETYDLTSKAEFITDAGGEVESDNAETFKNFLRFVQRETTGITYDKTVLILSDHGSGVGEYISSSSRAMFQDITTKEDGSAMMTSKDCAAALTDAEYTNTSKFDLMIFDLCLSGSIEDAYCFRNNANYMLASPETMYSNGHDYVKLFAGISTNMTIPEFAQLIMNQYKTYYEYSNSNWKNALTKYQESCRTQLKEFEDTIEALSEYQNETSEYKQLVADYTLLAIIFTNRLQLVEKWTIQDYQRYDANVTLSLFDLSKAEAATAAIESFAQRITSCDTDTQEEIRDLLWRRNSKTAIPNTPYYTGSFAYQYDLGTYVANIREYAETNGYTDLCLAAETVSRSLQEMILYAWRDGYVYKSADSYSTKILDNCAYGITICGESNKKREEYSNNLDPMVITAFPESYTTEYIPFVVAAPSWASLLETWFGAGLLYN